MNRNVMKPGLIFGVVTVIGGCAMFGGGFLQNAKFWNNSIASSYTYSNYTFLGQKEGVPLHIESAQPEQEKAVMYDRIAEALDPLPQFYHAKVRPAGLTDKTRHKLVFLVSPSNSFLDSQVCAPEGDEAFLRQDDDHRNLEIMLVYCQGKKARSSVRGSLDEYQGPDGEAFRQFAALAAKLVLPLRNPDRAGDCGSRPSVNC